MFLDTSGLLSLLWRKEKHFATASRFYEVAPSKLTTDYVLTELVALAQTRRVPRAKVLEFLAGLLDDDEVVVVFASEQLFAQGVQLLHQRPDKTYSLCDAVSFVLMRARGETEALTTDGHFEQEGFRRLLKE